MKLNLKSLTSTGWQRGSPSRLRSMIESLPVKPLINRWSQHSGDLELTSASTCVRQQNAYVPRPYQLEGINYLRTYGRRFLGDKPGLGKGGTLSTRILTPTGWTTFAAIKVGDKVLGSDGMQHIVTGVFPRGKLEVFKVSFQDGSTVVCDDDHLWCVQTHNDRVNGKGYRVKSLHDIRTKITDRGGRRQHFIPMMSPAKFATAAQLPIDAYVLGVILGDGCISQRVISVSIANKELLRTFSAALPENVFLSGIEGSIDYNVVSEPRYAPNALVNAIRQLKLAGCTSDNKFIPKEYLLASIEDRINLLQGLMDTDGEIRLYDGHCEYSTVSKQLANDFVFLVQSLGGTAKTAVKQSTFTYKGLRKNGKPCYRISINLPSDICIARAKIYLPKEKYLPYRVMTSIESVGQEEVVCISVDAPDQCYITDNCIVTHNTLQASYAAEPPVLIACPGYLSGQWADFLHECGCSPVIAAGTRAEREAALAERADWTIINIEMMRGKSAGTASSIDTDADAGSSRRPRTPYHFEDRYRTLIVDESHHLRGRSSLQSLGALDIAKRTERVYLLTGTPIYNRPDDLYAQLRMLDPNRFTSYWNFVEAYCKSVEMPFGPQVRKGRPELKTLFERYALARDYTDVGIQLPELIKSVIRVDAPPDWQRTYKAAKERYVLPDGSFAESTGVILHTLRRLTAVPKLRVLAELLADTDALTGSIIFCWYKDTAKAIGTLLGIPCITGDDPAADRVAIAQADTCVVATIESLKEGANLGHMHTVIFFELDHVPGRLYQALMRVRGRRVGGSIRVYYPLVRGSADEVIYNESSKRSTSINEIVRKCLE